MTDIDSALISAFAAMRDQAIANGIPRNEIPAGGGIVTASLDGEERDFRAPR